ncbi:MULTISPECIES: hypothetical protein [Pantoea]|uniref:hypothetical protein n=1 Tax=Pantoea TaxID=53335 RepID=UPI000D70F73C|nr:MULTISPECIES: hypothetical protein [Pantoea]MDN4134054.1 hypothetical protein [Pantoea ananatis]PWW10413.1 hypothetical protein DFO57_11330 [Pantoea sp. AG702]
MGGKKIVSSGQLSNGLLTLAGTILGAAIAALSGIGAAQITSKQAAEAADKANLIHSRSSCLQSASLQEQNLRSHASVFLGSIGAFRNTLSHPQLYKKEDFTKNMDLIVVNGMETSAFTSTALSDLTIRLSDSARKLTEMTSNTSNEELTINALLYNQLTEAWLKQYRLDLDQISKERSQCELK